MSYENVKKSRYNLKRRLVYIMGGKCQICGYDRCQSALDFHHLDPNIKEFSFAGNPNIGFDKAKEEVKKCILVCANCHREIHAGVIDCPTVSSYDEIKAEEIQKELDDFKTKTIHYCKGCGKIISAKAEYCKECSNTEKRVVKERPTRDELKQMIRLKTFTQIANEYMITDNAVRKWCDTYNLPRTKKEIKKYTDEEWEKR